MYKDIWHALLMGLVTMQEELRVTHYLKRRILLSVPVSGCKCTDISLESE